MKRIPLIPTIVVTLAVAAMIGLGLWQLLDRAPRKEAYLAQLAANPAKALGLDAGRLAVGLPADLLLFDDRAPVRITGDAFASAGNTPFDGLPAEGKALRLWKAGRALS